MPKKRFLGNRSFKVMGGAPQAFNAPNGARGARPMSLRGGTQSQWLGSSRVGTLMRQDVYIKNDQKEKLAPMRPTRSNDFQQIKINYGNMMIQVLVGMHLIG